jgi:hypothetical protein
LPYELNEDASSLFNFGSETLLGVSALGRSHEEKRSRLSARQKQEEDGDQAPANAGEEWLQR